MEEKRRQAASAGRKVVRTADHSSRSADRGAGSAEEVIRNCRCRPRRARLIGLPQRFRALESSLRRVCTGLAPRASRVDGHDGGSLRLDKGSEHGLHSGLPPLEGLRRAGRVQFQAKHQLPAAPPEEADQFAWRRRPVVEAERQVTKRCQVMGVRQERRHERRIEGQHVERLERAQVTEGADEDVGCRRHRRWGGVDWAARVEPEQLERLQVREGRVGGHLTEEVPDTG